MRVLRNDGSGFIGARLRAKWRADGGEPMTWPRPPQAATRRSGEFERIGTRAYDQSVPMRHAPQIDWQEDPR